MRRIFLVFVFLLAACSSAPALPTTPPALTITATLAVSTLTATLRQAQGKPLAPSATPYPTETPAPPTQTPLPTIPTFTPTFDTRTIVTATPAPKAECPKTNPSLVPGFPHCGIMPGGGEGCSVDPLKQEILDFLNAGGAIRSIIKDKKFPYFDTARIAADLTEDGIPEYGYSDFFDKFLIYGCSEGRYEILLNARTEGYSQRITSIKDLNGNGMPDILLAEPSTGGAIYLQVYEWNGKNFQPLPFIYWDGTASDGITFDSVEDIAIKDTDHNTLFEVIVQSDIPSNLDIRGNSIPSRGYTATLAWNGSQFVISKLVKTSPEYRFQAIQDADIANMDGQYQTALELYQQAVFSDKLEWWSAAREIYLRYILFKEYKIEIFDTPVPEPSPDLTEYPRLAAYAYYRMVILHTYLGETDAAQLKYATLQEKFPPDNLGHPYVEMAATFWDAYQSSQKMYDACAAAIAYADEHPEILVPLGSDYHGAQSHTYVPADVCPFR